MSYKYFVKIQAELSKKNLMRLLQKSDHSSIARFRHENAKELEALFIEILRLCVEAVLVKVGTVALDGTKIETNAFLSIGQKNI